jgi:hypothetical protein
VKALEVKKKYEANRPYYDAKAQNVNGSSINRVSYINQPKNEPQVQQNSYPIIPQQSMVAPAKPQSDQEQQTRFQNSIVFPKVSAVNKIQDDRYQKVFPSNISSSQIKRNFSNKVDLSKIVSYVN